MHGSGSEKRRGLEAHATVMVLVIERGQGLVVSGVVEFEGLVKSPMS